MDSKVHSENLRYWFDIKKDDMIGKHVVGYCDSDYTSDLDQRRSTTGYMFTLVKAPVS